MEGGREGGREGRREGGRDGVREGWREGTRAKPGNQLVELYKEISMYYSHS